MHTAKLFINGKSQAVRLPKEFRFEGTEVIIKRVGNTVVLFPRRYDPDEFKKMIESLDSDFRIERRQPRRPQKRPALRVK